MCKVYALYKGEDILSIGTTKEICEELNITPNTLYFYGSPTYKRRISKRKNMRNARELVVLEERGGNAND